MVHISEDFQESQRVWHPMLKSREVAQVNLLAFAAHLVSLEWEKAFSLGEY